MKFKIASFRISRKAKEISVQWLESKDRRKIHRINVKHIVGDLFEIDIGMEIVVRLNTRRYRAMVVDLTPNFLANDHSSSAEVVSSSLFSSASINAAILAVTFEGLPP